MTEKPTPQPRPTPDLDAFKKLEPQKQVDSLHQEMVNTEKKLPEAIKREELQSIDQKLQLLEQKKDVDLQYRAEYLKKISEFQQRRTDIIQRAPQNVRPQQQAPALKPGENPGVLDTAQGYINTASGYIDSAMEHSWGYLVGRERIRNLSRTDKTMLVAGTAGLVLLAGWGLTYVAKGLKRAYEGASSFFNTLKWMGITAAAGVAGYFGYRLYREVEDLRERLPDLRAAADQAVTSVLSQLSSRSVGRAIPPLATLAAQLTAAHASIPAADRAEFRTQHGLGAMKEVPGQGNAVFDVAFDGNRFRITERVIEQAAESPMVPAARGMVALHSRVDRVTLPDTMNEAQLSQALVALLQRADIRSIRVTDLAAWAAAPSGQPPIAGLNDSERRALFFFAQSYKASQDAQPRLQGRRGFNADTATVGQYLTHTNQWYRMLGREHVAFHSGRPRDNAENLAEGMREVFSASSLSQEAAAPEVQERLREIAPGLAGKELAFIQYCARHAITNVTLPSALPADPAVSAADLEVFRGAFRSIRQEVHDASALLSNLLREHSDDAVSAHLQMWSRLTAVDLIQLSIALREARWGTGGFRPEVANAQFIGKQMLQRKLVEILSRQPANRELAFRVYRHFFVPSSSAS